jgi:hypothetical protein
MNLDVHCLFSAIVIRSLARRKRKANRQHEQQTVMHSKRLSVHIPSESTYQSNAKLTNNVVLPLPLLPIQHDHSTKIQRLCRRHLAISAYVYIVANILVVESDRFERNLDLCTALYDLDTTMPVSIP